MAKVSLLIHGVDRITERFRGLQNVETIIDPDVRRWTKGFVLRNLYGEQNYAPPIRPGLWRAKTTLAQKKAFFARMRDGGWRGRTGALGQAWTVEQVSNANYRIRNSQPYANWIVGNAIGRQQTGWAREYWWRYRDRVDSETPELMRRIEDSIIRYWSRGGAQGLGGG